MCPEDQFGEGACCNILTAVSVPAEGNFGGFSKGIWKLDEGQALTDGYWVDLCVNKEYVEAHAAHEEETGENTMSATQNLQIVLDTVPNVREAYDIVDAETAEDWIEMWGADLDTINALVESAKCGDPADMGAKTLAASVVAVAAAALYM